ncbi:MAG: sulfatase-like hydrolase/transferase [candidate division KSB1 bacterium]|nr:sulfatase-like hydrolase/transferase [candidate division KSB1 bacterium]
MNSSHQNRRSFLKTFGTGSAVLAAGSLFSCSRAQQPNVLFLFTDDQRFNTLNALNNPDIQTPNLDRLVRRGLAFTNAYIMGGFSGAICMPSRAMLMTGRHLFHIQDNGRSIPDEHIMMPEYFRSKGFQTFGTGKWHNGRSAYARCFTDGDEIMFGGMGDHWNVPAYHFDPHGRYDQTTPVIEDPWRSNEITRKNYDHIYAGVHSSELFTQATLTFLRNRDRGKPFFAYVSYMAPHDPRSMPESYRKMYDPETIKLPPNFQPVHPFDNGELKIRDEMLADFPRTPDEVRQHIADYYAMITHLDTQIGRILDELQSAGDMDNTFIVFAGDNGLAVGQHGLMGKQNMYEHSVHVPLVITGPALPENETREGFCYLFDIFPTLCSLYGFEIPGTVDGQSLLPMIREQRPVREDVFFAYKYLQRGYRKNDWKLIKYNVSGVQHTQLFNLVQDPHEMTNLTNDPDYREILKDLTASLQDRMHNAGDPVDLGKPDWNL